MNLTGAAGLFLQALQQEGQQALAEYLTQQRWFAGKGRTLKDVRVGDWAPVPGGADSALMTVLAVTYADAPPERYLLPLVLGAPPETPSAASVRRPPARLTLSTAEGAMEAVDATGNQAACLALVEGIRQQHRWAGAGGVFLCHHTRLAAPILAAPIETAKTITAEQSNTSVVYDHRLILKVIRKLEPGLNPDFEVMAFLTEQTSYRHVPLLLGHIHYQQAAAAPEETTVAVLQSFIPNHGDGWSYTQAHLKALLDQTHLAGGAGSRLVHDFCADFLQDMRRLGKITGELHEALASAPATPAFCPEPITQEDVAGWREGCQAQIRQVRAELEAAPELLRTELDLTAASLAALETACLNRLADLSLLLDQAPVAKIRCHGDYHLGQVLKTDQGFVILDFEGEPARPLAERRGKSCPLKDVAGMLRSFSYAAQVSLRQDHRSSAESRAVIECWEAAVVESFLDGYFAAAQPGKLCALPPSREQALRVVQVFQLDKAIYELRYELHHRPDWITIPMHGLRAMLG